MWGGGGNEKVGSIIMGNVGLGSVCRGIACTGMSVLRGVGVLGTCTCMWNVTVVLGSVCVI